MAVAAAVLAALVCPAPAGATQSGLTGTESDVGAGEQLDVEVRRDTVEGADGTRLAATVYEPAISGPHPLLVVPGPWIRLPLDHVTHVSRYRALARSGYVVVAYDPRGFRASGGYADLAGRADVADASRVVDWALAHTAADHGRIGALGASYGAVIALNAAAQDARIKAVVALSGWAELSGGFRVNGTRAASVVLFQELFGRVDGRYGPEVERAFDQAVSQGLDESDPWVRQRSPAAHTTGLNRNRTAVFMVGEWDDPIVPAGQTGAFLDQLTGPKTLRMYPGGHADSHTASTGIAGRPQAWEEAMLWLRHHVRDPGDGRRWRPHQPTVVLQPRTGGPLEEYSSWAVLQQASRMVPLTAEPGKGRLVAGLPSAAESGPFPVSGPLDAAGAPPVTAWPLLTAPTAATFTSGSHQAPAELRGHALVEGTLIPCTAQGTVVAHLYDIGPLGTARLLTHAPYTFWGRRPGEGHRFTVRLPATAWNIPAGHRIGLVFDTLDHRYISENPIGAALIIEPSSLRLTVPLIDSINS
ncbi:CocE/NonD family hydrolase [Streptomyces sp. Wb2n-11]|uniref:CocE/NonD family hydrolase n=1 Tax=Streptomyces sp. Wb2n-11 TaxID=1030533 RepID=UPI000AEE60D4|nr:CocE/NonD family hydrolase [Streptomyces sp. Wb2n-11]